MTKDIELLAVGELTPDLIFSGMVSMPVPGREILAPGYVLTLGSSTAICAAAAAKLGLNTYLLSLVGDDVFGNACLDLLKETGIHTELVKKDPSVQTGITVSLTNQRDRALVTALEAISIMEAPKLSPALLERVRHIHVGSFFLQTALRSGLAELFRQAKEANITTSLDAGWDDTGCWDYGLNEVLRYTDLFFPNESEATAITGTDDPEAAARELAKRVRCVVVKCGAAGSLFCRGDELLRFPAVSGVKVVDTTGAGDSFNAGFLYGFVRGMAPRACLACGTACAAISITRLGGASSCATLAEVESVIQGRLPT